MNVSAPTPDAPPGGDQVDAARWPGVAIVPRCSPPRALLGRLLLTRALDRLPLHVAWGEGPEGRRLGKGGPWLRVRDTDAFDPAGLARHWDRLLSLLGRTVLSG